MRLLIFIVLFPIGVFAQMPSTYTIKPNHIKHLEYTTQEAYGFSNQVLNIQIKKEYWGIYFDFFFQNIGNEVAVAIDHYKISPIVMDILFSDIQIHIPKDINFSVDFSSIMKQNHEPTGLDDKNNFLQEMLIKYPNNYHIIYQLIYNYHENNTPKDSQKVIDLYESINNDEMNKKLLHNAYERIFDCYVDLNQTDKAMVFLDLSQKFITNSEHYLLLEKKASLFNDLKQFQKSKYYYIQSLKVLHKTDFSLGMLNLTSEQKESYGVMKFQELNRLEKIIKALK